MPQHVVDKRVRFEQHQQPAEEDGDSYSNDEKGGATYVNERVEDVVDEERHDAEGWNGQGEQITMAITANRSRLGCCYFDGAQGKVFIMEDTSDNPLNWDLVATS